MILGLKVHTWWNHIQRNGVLHLYRRNIVAEAEGHVDVVKFHDKGFCLSCMRETGFQVRQVILANKHLKFEALDFKKAGYTLEEVVCCFQRSHPLRIHPPVTDSSLFDSQLKRAGYSAADFRAARYPAHVLSERYFYKDADIYGYLYPSDMQWEECIAFYTALELKEAGYDIHELSAALFTMSELLAAGFSANELNSLTNCSQGMRVCPD